MSLQDEITKKAGEIYRESYQMSIGELINIYRDGEMDIHPEFQRVFRWNDYQKTKLIESIVLNIPIPQIFVSQSDDGTWDIIDGVQRLSTIFQFVGILKDDDGKNVQPLVLEATDALPSFAGMKWVGDGDFVFSKEQQLSLKRARLDITIIKKESDINTKYELFQRLNTGGSLLSDQEVRNCLIIMSNKTMYNFLDDIVKMPSYDKCMKISDQKTDEQYAMEMIVRLLVSQHINWENIQAYKDFAELLDKEILIICEKEEFDYEETKRKFANTFDLLFGTMGEDVFRKYESGRHKGAFLAGAFQSIVPGVYENIDSILGLENPQEWIKQKIEDLYNDDVYVRNNLPGVRAIPRYKELSIWSRDYFRL